LNAKDNSIQIESNEFIETKHGSGETAYVDPSLMRELLGFKRKTSETFVVNSRRGWKPTMYGRYPTRVLDAGMTRRTPYIASRPEDHNPID
jgi:hypothetical protein